MDIEQKKNIQPFVAHCLLIWCILFRAKAKPSRGKQVKIHNKLRNTAISGVKRIVCIVQFIIYSNVGWRLLIWKLTYTCYVSAILANIPFEFLHYKNHYSVPNLCWQLFNKQRRRRKKPQTTTKTVRKRLFFIVSQAALQMVEALLSAYFEYRLFQHGLFYSLMYI